MANNADDQPTFDAIEALFKSLSPTRPFNEMGGIMSEETGYEMDPQNGQIQPVGWVADGVIGANNIVPGFGLADTTAPAAPTGLSLTSEVRQQPDAGLVLDLVATLTQPADTDLFASYVQVTSRELSPGTPDWDRPSVLLIGKNDTKATIPGVAGGTLFYARAQAADQSGNRSAYTSVVSATTGADTVAPPIPVGVAVLSGFRGFGVSWSPSTAADLAFHELRYAPSVAGAPDTTAWSYIRIRTNAMFVPNLDAITYWVQVRAVDRSGNVVTSAADSTAVNYLTTPEAGWTTAASVTPTIIGAADVAFNTATMNLVNAGIITADVVQSGTLKVGSASDAISGILVTDGTTTVGFWDQSGIKIIDPSNSSRYVLLDAGQIKFTTDAGATFPAAITPDGINASAINFGTAPGGHNLILNSSFELAAFIAAAAVYTFTDTAEWKAANRTVALDNITEGTSLSMTAATF